MRTDVGGVYRRAPGPSPLTPTSPYQWIPLLEFTTPSNSDYFSTSALAMDPQNGANIYVLSGGYWAWSNCSVLISTDAGASWEVSPSTNGWGLRCGGNENDRAVGDRLSVHPSLPNTVVVAGSDGRVYVSTTGFRAAIPPQCVTLPAPASTTVPPCNPKANSNCVVRSVFFLRIDPQLLLLIAAVPDLGFFASAGPDYADPKGWSFVKGSDAPQMINRFAVIQSGANPGSFWATAQRGGVWLGVVSGNPSSGWSVAWSIPGALSYADVPFSGVAVSATGEDVAVLSFETNSNTSLWRSLDGGVTFKKQLWQVNSTVPWWGGYTLQLNAASSLAFESGEPPLLWATDFFGTYFAPAPTNSTLFSFWAVEAGHEEVCLNVIRAPSLGKTISGSADVGGFLHNNGDALYPSKNLAAADGWAHNCLFDASFTLSHSPTGLTQDTLYVTAGDEYGSCHGSPSWCGLHSWVGVSRDGGASFQDTNWDNIYGPIGGQANPYRVIVHPDDGSRALVCARSGLPLTYTRDFGVTWANSSGPEGVHSVGEQGNFWFAQPFARELNDGATSAATEFTVYFYNGTTTLFTSRDSGATFETTFDKFPSWNTPLFSIATPPRGTSSAGDIWAFAGWKLYHSVNGGVNFTQVWQVYGVEKALAVGPLPGCAGSVPSGDLALKCAMRAEATAEALGKPPLPIPHLPLPSGASPGYTVYFVGPKDYGVPESVYASIDFGHSWIPLAGPNSSTPSQGLGDTPYVLEPSLRDPGVLYVGTEGRGGYFRNTTEELCAALLACSA